MSLFARPRPRPVERRAVSFQDVFGKGLEWNPSGVTESTVMGLDAVAAAVGLFTDMIQMLPVDVFSGRPGGADPMVDAPPLVANPSDLVDPLTWRAQAMVSCLIWGNAYGLVSTRDRFGFPETVDWLDPSLMTVVEAPLRRPVYQYAGRTIDPDGILHQVGRYVRPGSVVGVAPLERFKETFQLALMARQFGSDWFRNGSIPAGIVKSKRVDGEDDANAVKRKFKKAAQNRDVVVVNPDFTEYEKVGVAANESQFGETLDRSAVAVARVFGLPPEMIAAAMSGSSVTYANREQRAIDFLTFAADPWLVRFEQMWTRNMPTQQYAKFNRGALLRTDLLTRYQAHDIAIRSGLDSVEHRRDLEDLPPFTAGDTHLWPPYASSAAALSGDAQ